MRPAPCWRSNSTVATPVLTRPLRLGADLVMHSAIEISQRPFRRHRRRGRDRARRGAVWERIKTVRTQLGAIIGPFEAWLLLRGLRTLDVRVRTQAATAMQIADPPRPPCPGRRRCSIRVSPAHPGHAVAARQMIGGFGAHAVDPGRGRRARRHRGRRAGSRLWKRATSLGGVESLIEHRASVEGAHSPCPPDLLRLSVGLEDPDDLMGDLDRAAGRGQERP